MDSKLYALLVSLDQELTTYLKAHHIDVAKISPRKVAFICSRCQRSFRAVKGGLKCPGCGDFVRIRWADGRDLTVYELLEFVQEDNDKAA